jgi:hypothetical protein
MGEANNLFHCARGFAGIKGKLQNSWWDNIADFDEVALF